MISNPISGGATEFYVPVSYYKMGGTAVLTGNHVGCLIDGAGEECYFEFGVPSDFTSLTNLKIIGISHATDADKMVVDIDASFFASGEVHTAHTVDQDDVLSEQAPNNVQYISWELQSYFGALAANDIIGIEFLYAPSSGVNIATDCDVLVLWFNYA